MTALSKTEKRRLKRERVTRRRRIRWTAIGLLLAVLVGGGGYYSWSVRNAPLAGSPALDFALQDQDGRTVRLADFRGKQEVILLFYMGALWDMCRRQLVKLPPKIGTLKAKGAAVLGISIDTPAEARRMALELGLTFPILSDPRMEVIQAYGMKGEGMDMSDMGYVVIDRQGQVRRRKIDRQFGDNINAIVETLDKIKREA